MQYVRHIVLRLVVDGLVGMRDLRHCRDDMDVRQLWQRSVQIVHVWRVVAEVVVVVMWTMRMMRLMTWRAMCISNGTAKYCCSGFDFGFDLQLAAEPSATTFVIGTALYKTAQQYV